jgi:hypothetical protein
MRDGVVQLGGPNRKNKPAVRWIVAVLPDGKDLILARVQFAWSAEEILAAYKRAWQLDVSET